MRGFKWFQFRRTHVEHISREQLQITLLETELLIRPEVLQLTGTPQEAEAQKLGVN